MADDLTTTTPLQELLNFSLVAAIFGRRSRRFGLGMDIPSCAKALKSRHEPVSLSELEQALLVAAATGVSGWNFGIPFISHRSREYAHYTERFTGRAAQISAAIGTPVLFHTDEKRVYLTSLRDTQSSRMSEFERGDDVARGVAVRDKEALEKR